MSGSFDTAATAENLKNKLEQLRIAAYDASQGADLDMDAIRNLPGGANNPLPEPEPDPIRPGGGGSSSGGGRTLDSGIERLREQEQLLAVLGAGSEIEKRILEIEHDRINAIADIRKNYSAVNQEALVANENAIAAALTGEAYGQMLAESAQQAAALRQAQEDTLRPLQEQRELLEAKLNGTEDEVRLRQQVDALMRQAPGLERSEVEELVKGNAALEERVAIYETQAENAAACIRYCR